jgi:hypothetical protein
MDNSPTPIPIPGPWSWSEDALTRNDCVSTSTDTMCRTLLTLTDVVCVLRTGRWALGGDGRQVSGFRRGVARFSSADLIRCTDITS